MSQTSLHSCCTNILLMRLLLIGLRNRNTWIFHSGDRSTIQTACFLIKKNKNSLQILQIVQDINLTLNSHTPLCYVRVISFKSGSWELLFFLSKNISPFLFQKLLAQFFFCMLVPNFYFVFNRYICVRLLQSCSRIASAPSSRDRIISVVILNSGLISCGKHPAGVF